MKFANIPNGQLNKILQDVTKQLWNEFNISDVLLQKYIAATILELAPKLKNALENNRLESIFVSFKEKHPQQVIQYKDGEKMDDELFRTIADEIRECRYVSDKIAIIQRNIHSIMDLIDILESYCLFGDEFAEIFRSLGDTELAVLLKRLPTHVIDLDYHFTGNEKEWHNRLTSFFEKMDLARKQMITKLAEKINLG